jgi:hypothetical protein
VQVALANRGLAYASGVMDERSSFIRARVKGNVKLGVDDEVLAELRAKGHVIAGIHIEPLRAGRR